MKYRIQTTPAINAKGMFNFAMGCNSETWDAQASDTASRMYMLAELMPTVSAKDIKLIAQKEVTVTFTETDDVLIDTKEPQQ